MDQTSESLSELTPDFSNADPEGYDWAAAAERAEKASERYLADAKRQAAIALYDDFAASAPALAKTDWKHQSLQPFRKQIGQVLGWDIDSPKGLLLTGPSGRAKTRSLVGLWQILAYNHGRDVRYWHASDFFKTMCDQIAFGRDEAMSWVEAVAERPLVFIDDFGQEAVQSAHEDRAQAWFFRFLDLRVAKGHRLFITTNMSARQMAERSDRNRSVRGDPLIRRLLDLCEPIQFLTEAEKAKLQKQ